MNIDLLSLSFYISIRFAKESRRRLQRFGVQEGKCIGEASNNRYFCWFVSVFNTLIVYVAFYHGYCKNQRKAAVIIIRYTKLRHNALADLERGGYGGLQSPLSNFKNIKRSNKTKQKIEDNPLEKEKERKSCMFV